MWLEERKFPYYQKNLYKQTRNKPVEYTPKKNLIHRKHANSQKCTKGCSNFLVVNRNKVKIAKAFTLCVYMCVSSYVFVCMCVFMFIHVCVHMCICMRVYVYYCMCVFVYVCLYVYVCACVCMYEHECVCLCVCMCCECLCVCVCMYVCVSMWKPGPTLVLLLGTFSALILDTRSPTSHRLGWLATSPRDLPFYTCIALGLLAHNTMSAWDCYFLNIWILEIKFRSSCL